MLAEKQIRDALQTVLDPELGINIIDLGLVYEVESTPDRINVVMTMTTAACPLHNLLSRLAADAVRKVAGPDIEVDVQINVIVGPEAITGSTRLKAATAQKMILNMITTASMVKLGSVYENLMVDLKPTSEKLVERAKGIIMMLSDADYEEAGEVFDRSGRNVKASVIMIRKDVDREEALRLIKDADGFLARALGER